MSKASPQLLLSGFYSLGQITLGLLVHPYQTMQLLVEDKVFVWMSLLPTLILAVLTIFWRFLLVPMVQVVFTCQTSSLWACEWLSFVSNFVTFYCIYWQVLLMYLLFRFRAIFG